LSACWRSCGDHISVHDGRDATTPIVLQLCADADNATLTSSADRLFVHFVSDDRLEAQGFAAYFRFVPRDRPTTSGVVTPPARSTGKHTRRCD